MSDVLSSSEEDDLDAIVAAHIADWNTGEPILNRDNIPVYSPTYSYYPDNLKPTFKGWRYTATAGTQSIFDIEVTSEIRLQGGICHVHNPSDVVSGDYVEFSVVDKDDVLGLFDSLGLTVGVDVLELAKFCNFDYTTIGQETPPEYINEKNTFGMSVDID